jgi:hypothetical protein
VPRRRFQDDFFVPFNGSDFGFRSKASNDFGCGVNFFLRASEQASRAKNRWYETPVRVCTKIGNGVPSTPNRCNKGPIFDFAQPCGFVM